MNRMTPITKSIIIGTTVKIRIITTVNQELDSSSDVGLGCVEVPKMAGFILGFLYVLHSIKVFDWFGRH